MRFSLKLVVTLSVSAIALAYIYAFTSENLDRLLAYDFRIIPVALFVALSFTLAGHFFNVIYWKFCFRLDRHEVSLATAWTAWSISRLARYTPGKVLGIAARLKLHGANSYSRTFTAMLLEVACSYIAVAALGLALAPALGLDTGETLMLASLLTCMIAGLFYLPAIVRLLGRRFPSIGSRIKGVAVEPMGLGEIIKLTLAYLPIIFLHGAGFFTLAYFYAGIAPDDFFAVVILFYLAGVIGQLALLVPAGMGVKEASLLFFVAPLATDTGGLVIAVLISRLLLLASELLHGSASVLYQWPPRKWQS